MSSLADIQNTATPALKKKSTNMVATYVGLIWVCTAFTVLAMLAAVWFVVTPRKVRRAVASTVAPTGGAFVAAPIAKVGPSFTASVPQWPQMDIQIKQAREFMAEGRFADARRVLEPAQDRLPRMYILKVMLAQTCWAAADYVGAQQWLEELVQMNPWDDHSRIALLALFLVKGRFEAAMSLAEWAKASGSDPLLIDRMLGYVYLHMDKIDEALEALNRAHEKDKTDLVTINNLGVALSMKGNQDVAVRLFEGVIASKPDLQDAHFNLVLVRLVGAIPEEMVSALERARQRLGNEVVRGWIAQPAFDTMRDHPAFRRWTAEVGGAQAELGSVAKVGFYVPYRILSPVPPLNTLQFLVGEASSTPSPKVSPVHALIPVGGAGS